VKALRDHLPEVAATPTPRIVYADLDGTLLGPGGSLFAASDLSVTEAPARAVASLHRAGVQIVPVSGRTSEQLWEVARLVGATDFVAELGGIVSLDRQREVLRRFGAFSGEGTPHQDMIDSGAAGLLLDSFSGRLEPHAPWAFLPRECSILLRGEVSPAEAARVLSEAGHGWLELRDNGVIPRDFPGLDVHETHAYHLIPRGVSKAAGVSAHREHRRLRPQECIAIGDSPADAELASEVAAVFIVANGRDPVRRAGAVPDNVYATEASHGDGFAEAVTASLGSDRH
jgi:phosphoglycolate phosphatase